MVGLKGAFGKQVVFRQRNGKTIVSSYPDFSERVLSPKQLEVNRVMTAASAYAKSILEDEQKRGEAQIRLDLPSNRLYGALVREYFRDNYKKTTPVSGPPVASLSQAASPSDAAPASKKKTAARKKAKGKA